LLIDARFGIRPKSAALGLAAPFLVALALVFLRMAPAAAGVLLSELTLDAVPPPGFAGQAIGNWTPDDLAALPGFAKATVYLAPGADYYVKAVGGGWNFAATVGAAPNYSTGCTSAGCATGWLNLFLIHDDRGVAGQPGNETDGFSDPGPPATAFATAQDAIDAATWHFFDVKPDVNPAVTLVPVTFFIFDTDYTDNLGGLTLAIAQGADVGDLVGILPEPAPIAVFGTGLLLVLAVRRRARPTAESAT